MSGIVVLVRRDRKAVDGDHAKRMLARLHHRAIDGDRLELLGWAAVGHAHFWTTPEEVGERLPLAGDDGRLCLAFDGRLDNRGELGAALGLTADELEDRSDAALALAALERWGSTALSRFVGPFALALVDRREGWTLLARDVLGDRGLFYALPGSHLVAASEEAAVVAFPEVSSELDEGRLILHLAVREPVDDRTFFRGVKQVLPGHFVLVRERGVESGCFRSVRVDPDVRRCRDEELIERFRHALVEAVACRMRAVGRTGVLLSGGLDSGPVAALAAQAAENRSLAAPLAVSWGFSRFAECDERPHIEAITARYGLEAEVVSGDDALPLARLERWPHNPNTPTETLYRWLSEGVYRRGRERGCRVLLSGATGDDLYLGARDWLWSLLGGARVGAAFRGARSHARDHGARAFLRTVVVSPQIPDSLRRVLRPTRPPDWLTEHALSLWPKERGWLRAPGGARRPGQLSAAAGLGNAGGISAEVFHASRCGVELRYPFRDLRLVELMLGVPSRLLYDGLETRPILRRALHADLPPSVLGRRDKADFSPLYAATLESAAEGGLIRSILEDPYAAWRRYVRPEWVAEAPPGHRSPQIEDVALWYCVWLEIWRKRLLLSDSVKEAST